MRQGAAAPAWELHLAARPWGVNFRNIEAEVHLWHGEDDAASPVAMGRFLAQEIPRCSATFLAGEGHFLYFDHWDTILRTLMSSG